MPPSVFPTGVTIYRPDKAYNCFVLHEGRDARSYLIDMNGNDVKVFDYPGFPAEMIEPRLAKGERGHVLLQKEPERSRNKTLLEVDWDGNIVWEWGEKAPGGMALQNHDLARLPNGNTLVLSYVTLGGPEAELGQARIRGQAIYEVNPGGDVVWRWLPSEHPDWAVLSTDAKELVENGRVRARSLFLGFNTISPLGQNKWYRAGDERFHPDNIFVCSPAWNFIGIIEKKTGDFVWSMGPDYPGAHDYSQSSFSGKLPRPVDKLSFQHDVHLIPEGSPGAGNVLVFDNEGPGGVPPFYLELFQGSRVLEIDPITKEIVWQYDASSSNQPYWNFFSPIISSARRLPNGNTLIDEGIHGRVFQVTPDGEIVWEYVNPHFGKHTGIRHQEEAQMMVNWVFRAQPVPYDWVPEGTPHSEDPVIPPKVSDFRIK